MSDLRGRCACGAVSYELSSEPMFTHNCHCRDCQILTGGSSVINAMIETDRVKIDGDLDQVHLPTPSGKGRLVKRCANCGTAVLTHYLVRGEGIAFIRVSTLDDPSACPPDVQIWTGSKIPWVPLSDDIPAYEGYYDMEAVWPPDAWARRQKAIAGS